MEKKAKTGLSSQKTEQRKRTKWWTRERGRGGGGVHILWLTLLANFFHLFSPLQNLVPGFYSNQYTLEPCHPQEQKKLAVYSHLSHIHVLMISTDLVLHFCFFTNNMLRVFYATLLIFLHFSWTESGLSKSDNYEIFF